MYESTEHIARRCPDRHGADIETPTTEIPRALEAVARGHTAIAVSTTAGGCEKGFSDSGETDHVLSDATALENYTQASLGTIHDIADGRVLPVDSGG